MEVDAAIVTLFPKSLDHWQKFLYQLILGIVVAVTVLVYADYTNPLFTSVKNLAIGILPWVYIAWILTGPRHGHTIALKTIAVAAILNLLATSVDLGSSPTWVQSGAEAANDLTLGLLQGAIFAAVYTFGKSS